MSAQAAPYKHHLNDRFIRDLKPRSGPYLVTRSRTVWPFNRRNFPRSFTFLTWAHFPRRVKPEQMRDFSSYLRTLDGTGVGAKVLPKELPTVGALGRGAAGPVFLHVGTTFVEPTGATYEPTEGCTTDPYPAVPLACASANVLVRVKAVASAIVVTFMRCPFLLIVR